MYIQLEKQEEINCLYTSEMLVYLNKMYKYAKCFSFFIENVRIDKSCVTPANPKPMMHVFVNHKKQVIF